MSIADTTKLKTNGMKNALGTSSLDLGCVSSFLLCVIRSAGSVLVVDTRQVIYGRHIRLLLLLLFRIVVKIVMLLNYLVVHHLVLLLILVLLLKQIDSCAVEAASVSVYCRRLYSRMM